MNNWQSKLDEISGQWDQHQLRNKAGLFALTHLVTINISGEDSAKFLQGQLTCDINEITENQYKLGACCTPKGRMVAIFRLIKTNNGYQFILDKDVAEILIKHLSKYIPFFKATLEQLNPQLCLGLSGSLTEISNLSETKTGCSCSFGSAQLLGYSENRWLLLVPPSELEKYWALFSKRSIVSSSTDWQYLDLLDKLPTVKSSSVEKFLPHEVALPEHDGVSFKKGCYTGQEIIARMQYLGKLNKHSQLLSSSSILSLAPSESVLIESDGDSINIGNLILSMTNTAGETLALICMKDKFLEMQEFQVIGENTSILKIL